MADPVDAAADHLYGLPLDEFTTARNAAAKALRDEGLRDEADLVKSFAKPTVAAWAANRLSRSHRSELEEYLGAADAARDAQLAGKGDLRNAVRRQRELLDGLVKSANDELGGEASEGVLGRVRQTLESAAVDDQAAAALRRGRLAKELEPLGFGTLLAHAPAKPSRKRAPAEDRAARQKAVREAQERLREAEDEHRAALAEERQAHRRWQQAAGDAEEAAERVEQARAVLEQARSR